MRAAARAACADEFIERLPQGYDSARRGGRTAPLRGPAAAARDRAGDLQGRADPHPRRGDVAARRGVRGARRPRPREPDAGRTTLVIAHRLSTVRRADRIVGARGRAHRRGGQPQRALDSARPLSQAARHAVFRRGRRGARAPRRSMTPAEHDGIRPRARRRSGRRPHRRGRRPQRQQPVPRPDDQDPGDRGARSSRSIRRAFARRLHRGKVEVALRLKRTSPVGAGDHRGRGAAGGAALAHHGPLRAVTRSRAGSRCATS